jgi:hypothetical protein
MNQSMEINKRGRVNIHKWVFYSEAFSSIHLQGKIPLFSSTPTTSEITCSDLGWSCGLSNLNGTTALLFFRPELLYFYSSDLNSCWSKHSSASLACNANNIKASHSVSESFSLKIEAHFIPCKKNYKRSIADGISCSGFSLRFLRDKTVDSITAYTYTIETSQELP